MSDINLRKRKSENGDDPNELIENDEVKEETQECKEIKDVDEPPMKMIKILQHDIKESNCVVNNVVEVNNFDNDSSIDDNKSEVVNSKIDSNAEDALTTSTDIHNNVQSICNNNNKVNENIGVSSNENKEVLQINTEEITKNYDKLNSTNNDTGQSQISSDTNESLQKSHEFDTNRILLTVNFKNKKITDTFKDKVCGALKSIEEFSVIEDISENKLVIMSNLNPDSELLQDLFDNNDTVMKRKKKHDRKKMDLFTVDTKPTFHRYENLKVQYATKFSLEKTEIPDKKDQKVFKSSCFNCSEDHNLRDCPHPKDFVRINKAKSKISKVTRYHLDDEQKYHDLKPGKMSQKLKEALGLRNNELPLFIYRMRELGYPPGWVEEAFEANSDLALFDSDGKSLNCNVKSQIKINPDKIIEYPGFNAPMDKHVKDDYKNYGTLKYTKHVNKDTIIEVIKKFKDNLESCDMDIDNDEDNEEKIQPPGCELNKSPRLSPSLVDLEEEKLKLLAELNQAEPTAIINQGESTAIINQEETTTIINQGETIATESPIIAEECTTKINEKSDGEMGDISEMNEESTQANVKTSTFGTPILDRKYPFSRLPQPENFSLNISPVINFENLPNSTGKYEQMVGILQKVRETLKNTNESKL